MTKDVLREVSVTLDDDANVRVLDKDQFDSTAALRDECKGFAGLVGDFTENVQTFVQVLEAQAGIIEREKLRAIGQRNLVEREVETRKLKKRQQLVLAREREAQLDRLDARVQSLEKVEADQLALIEKLCNNEI